MKRPIFPALYATDKLNRASNNMYALRKVQADMESTWSRFALSEIKTADSITNFCSCLYQAKAFYNLSVLSSSTSR